MGKIVIVASNSEKKKDLIECLTMLFPECDIEIRYKQADGFGDFHFYMKEDQKM